MSTRRERAQAFKEFSGNSESIFDSYWNIIPASDSLRSENRLNVCPKGANGGLDDTLIEVFFGFKYHSWQKEMGDNFSVSNKANMIYGARLEYQLTDKSHVLCILRPSKTDKLQPYEDGVLLEIVKDPSTLASRSKKHWDFLVSYMRATDVDGSPSVTDHLRTYWLRNTKRCFSDGKVATRKVVDRINTLMGWAFSVGLSGSLIFLITVVLNDSTQNEVVLKLDNVSASLSSIASDQKLLTQEIKALSTTLTSNQGRLIEKQEDTTVFLAGIYRLSESNATTDLSEMTFQKRIQKLEDKLTTINTQTSAALQEIRLVIKEKVDH
ncbi:hypothetical protein FCV66_19620 [Enterovibrio norvegicus]|uniref:hypothetical protein n=1 Tax=Enterovibrio norvegicus TaxID=188144 RepID=UPI000C8426D8|nr:hypothetical protein [Enterovibrio norvegicus]PMI26748.1 hypothetical protein BCU47_22870 [Enterovibrio norvegicus]TKF10570.1 hypothetical protein FCV66_19620 [Enterovibrio norvegicus]